MLAHKLTSVAPAILRGCSYHSPAIAVAVSRAIQTNRHDIDASNDSSKSSNEHNYQIPTMCSAVKIPSAIQRPLFIERHWFSTQPISSHGNACQDLSIEEFDNAYKFLYGQHNHPRGPWVKVLQSAQHILSGQKSPRVLIIASGPGEPAATLAQNFQNAEIVSAHMTAKCIEWADERFQNLGLTNVTSKLVSDMHTLDFENGSFDLVISGYGLANHPEPQAALNEVHRVLRPGGSLLTYVWEQLPADPGSDIILRHACVGPNPFKSEGGIDTVGKFRCPVRTKKAMSLSKPHLLEALVEKAKLSIIEVTRDEYPLKLGNSKEQAFKALALPIENELRELKASNHYHPSDAAEAFEDIVNEGFMVKQCDNHLEVPYNVYKYVVARRGHEDGDGYLESDKISKSNGRKTFTVNDIPK